MTDVTQDRLLGGRVTILQARDGYRAGIDPVLLAAAVPARSGETALDLGCGSGAAGLCLMARVPGVAVTGVELQPVVADWARRGRAGDAALSEVIVGDLRDLPDRVGPRAFDHVLLNPPYFQAARGTPPPDAGKAVAGIEEAPLEDWIAAACKRVRAKGSVTVIHRADRLADLLGAMAPRLGAVAVLPLWPAAGKPAKLVLVRGIKDRRTPLTVAPGLVLHGPDGAYTPEAEAVLRGGVPLDLG